MSFFGNENGRIADFFVWAQVADPNCSFSGLKGTLGQQRKPIPIIENQPDVAHGRRVGLLAYGGHAFFLSEEDRERSFAIHAKLL